MESQISRCSFAPTLRHATTSQNQQEDNDTTMARLHQKDGGMNEKNKRAAADPAMPPEGKKQKVHEDVADTGEAVQKMKPA
jgi:hypothetical protein